LHRNVGFREMPARVIAWRRVSRSAYLPTNRICLPATGLWTRVM
jgi:hypothetical protein